MKAAHTLQEQWGIYGKRVKNAWDIDTTLFKTDSNITTGEKIWEICSRFIWEVPQTVLGNAFSHFRNNINLPGDISISNYHGATLVNDDNPNSDAWGITLGSYINGMNLVADPVNNTIFAHEYGHNKQSNLLGPAYLFIVGIPSLKGSFLDYYLHVGNDHDREWYEVWANQLSYNYHDAHGYSDVTTNWNDTSNPRVQNLDWYFYDTVGYYVKLSALATLLFFL